MYEAAKKLNRKFVLLEGRTGEKNCEIKREEMIETREVRGN